MATFNAHASEHLQYQNDMLLLTVLGGRNIHSPALTLDVEYLRAVFNQQLGMLITLLIDVQFFKEHFKLLGVVNMLTT